MDEPSVSPQEVTELLAQCSHGDDAALAELTPLVYEELRRLAHHFMDREDACALQSWRETNEGRGSASPKPWRRRVLRSQSSSNAVNFSRPLDKRVVYDAGAATND